MRAGGALRARRLVPFAAVALVIAGALVACQPAPVVPTIGCDRAAERVQLASSANLDPTCTYTGGFDITASNVTLDCKGARVQATDPSVGGVGIRVTTPSDVPQSHVNVRNCTIHGFLNNLRVTRAGFKTLAAGAEYTAAGSDIVIQDSHLEAANGTGLYVDGFVTGVTLKGLDISTAGGAGIYLEAGSKGSVVRDNVIHGNGFAGVDFSTFTLLGNTVNYHSRGREGIAVDGSRDNLITGNRIADNAAGGVFLYKNCGEYVNQKPDQWWTRRYGADGNTISGNTIVGGRLGVWVASRASENLTLFDCSDPVIATKPVTKIYADHAERTSITRNTFQGTTWGVRVEDDGTAVVDNTFTGADPAGAAVAIGTSYRTTLGHPVTGTTITGNRTDAAASTSPYRWTFGESGTTVTGNLAAGAPAALASGTVFAPDGFWSVASLIPNP